MSIIESKVDAASTAMEDHFSALCAAADRARVADERYTACFSAEESDFVRMNRGRVRQPGTVLQRSLHIRLIRGARHASHTLSLSGAIGADRDAVTRAITALRAALPELADDPHLLLPDHVAPTEVRRQTPLPPSEEIIAEVLASADGLDLVGMLAAGPLYRGFANSEGQRNWHAATTFNLQWSLYHRADKAVKSSFAGYAWDRAAFAQKMTDARERLALIGRPAKALEPGKYRAYIAPQAMDEIAALLCWGGFSGRALATKQSPLARMETGERLDSRVNVAEDTASGLSPAFQSDGFTRPDRVALIESGALVGSLVSPRTAREFGLAANGANGYEMPEALSISGGTLPMRDALAALDTGLAISNLWYLNYSDRPACRMTGMTRFATFWVENGKIVAPVNVSRFDDTIYRLLGSNLEELTAETELLLDADTYGERRLRSVRLPGALVSEMAFTL
jgi:predicted Zn-dependent protease